MAVLSKGTTFATGDQVTAISLNNLADNATFASGAVDNVSTQLSSGSIIVKDGGVSTTKIADSAVTAAKIASNALTAAYPVGSIYMNATNATNPATLLGFGTWVAFGAGKVPVGIDSGDTDFDTAEETGGAKTHTLSIGEMPAHDHVPNRNEFDTNNILLRRNANGSGSAGSADSTVGEPAISGSGNFDFPEIEGNGDAHNNLQPYIVVYMWKRTA
jgi:hypothetical protein